MAISSPAMRLRSTFDGFRGHATSAEKPTVLSAWNRQLDRPGLGQPSLIERISNVARDIGETRQQVEWSRILTDDEKGHAREILDGLEALVDLATLPTQAESYKDKFASLRTTFLLGIGRTLAQEFPDEQAEAEAVQSIIQDLNDLLQLVEDAPIALLLKQMLKRQLSALHWALLNPDLVGASAAFESLGPIMMASIAIEGSAKGCQDADTSTERVALAARVRDFVEKTGPALKVVWETFKGAKDLLEFARSSGLIGGG